MPAPHIRPTSIRQAPLPGGRGPGTARGSPVAGVLDDTARRLLHRHATAHLDDDTGRPPTGRYGPVLLGTIYRPTRPRRLLRMVASLLARSVHHRLGYTTWIGFGLVAGGTLVAGLSWVRGLSPVPMVGLIAVAVAALFVHLTALLHWTGRDRLVFYRHALVTFIAGGLYLQLTGAPSLLPVEVLMLGLGLTQAFGRIGCLTAGCCHGRPTLGGIPYAAGSPHPGLAPIWRGVPLFPLQAVEAGWILIVVAAGSLLVAGGAAPGTGLAVLVLGYALGRFTLEFGRGDTYRPVWRGLSEAQWTSLLVVAATLVTALIAGHAPVARAAALTGSLLAGAALLSGLRARAPADRLYTPHHLANLVRRVQTLRTGQERLGPDTGALEKRVHLVTTTGGLRLSAGLLNAPGAPVHTFTVSHRHLGASDARRLARLLLLTAVPAHPHLCAALLFDGGPGIYHVLLVSPGGRLPIHALSRTSPTSSWNPICLVTAPSSRTPAVT